MRLPAQHWQILIALVLAVAAGRLFAGSDAALDTFALLGALFLNALKLLIVPLVVAAIINGVGALSGSKLGRLGGLTLAFYVGSGLLAILTGLLFTHLLQPGIIDGKPAAQLVGLFTSTPEALKIMDSEQTGHLSQVLLMLVPPNLFAAAAQGQLLGLIGFCILFGYCITRLPEPLARAQREFWHGIYEVMLRITQWVMRFAPIGVFGLVAKVIAETNWLFLQPLALFFLTVMLGLLTHALITLPLVLRLVARVSPIAHYRAVAPALLTAFSTSSSAATLPVTLDCLEKRAKVPRRITSFVLPIGANVNTDGTALYECVVVLFIAQAYGAVLGLDREFIIVLGALLTGLGMAGIPSASLVSIAVILGAVGLPLEGIGLVLVVDRVLDMFRTSVNVLGDSCAAVTVARLDGETGVLQKDVSNEGT